MRKGYIVTWDALISLTFVIFLMMGFIGLQYSTYSGRGATSFEKLHTSSENAIDTINKQGVLEEIGHYWALGNQSMAANLTKQYLDNIIPPHMGYRLEAVDAEGAHIIYQTGDERPAEDDATDKVKSSRILSGYKENTPRSGWTARAWMIETNTWGEEVVSCTQDSAEKWETIQLQYPFQITDGGPCDGGNKFYVQIPGSATLSKLELNLMWEGTEELGTTTTTTITTTTITGCGNCPSQEGCGIPGIYQTTGDNYNYHNFTTDSVCDMTVHIYSSKTLNSDPPVNINPYDIYVNWQTNQCQRPGSNPQQASWECTTYHLNAYQLDRTCTGTNLPAGEYQIMVDCFSPEGTGNLCDVPYEIYVTSNTPGCLNNPPCAQTDESCGLVVCTDCNTAGEGAERVGDGCIDTNYINYICQNGNTCTYTTTTCNDADTCTEDTCNDYVGCVYTQTCEGTSTNCGCTTCTNCDLQGTGAGRTGDGCIDTNYIDYTCTGETCTYTTDDCTDCSCTCTGYGLETEEGYCEDGIDNDCDGLIDGEDTSDCCEEIIIDNAAGAPVYTEVESWITSTANAQKYSTNYRYRYESTGSATFTPDITTPGQYQIYLWWPAASNYADNSPITVTYSGGTDNSKTIDETTNGGKWNLIGTYYLDTGTSSNIKIHADPDTTDAAIADAAKFYHCTTTSTCEGRDTECGAETCINCDLDGTETGRTGDGCLGNSYIDYRCSGTDCVYTTDDCSDCSCTCGNYKLLNEVGYCEDEKDNDCDGQTDGIDNDCSNNCFDTGQNPIPLCTCEDLDRVRNYISSSFALQNDINFADCDQTYTTGEGFTPIGGTFTGNFNGQGYTITGLYINKPTINNVALFYTTGSSANIENLEVVNADITGSNYVSLISGYNYGNIINCLSSGVLRGVNYVGGTAGINRGQIESSQSATEINGNQRVGGITGQNMGKIINAEFTGTLISISDWAGGIVGYNDVNTAIINTISSGQVNCGNSYVGGITGINKGQINNTYSTGTVIGANLYTGGLVGYNNAGASILNSYSTASANGNQRVGGLVGENRGTITNSYTTATVTGSQYVGGLVGTNYLTVTNCWWNNAISSCCKYNIGTCTCTMASAASEFYSSTQDVYDSNVPYWDFTNVWEEHTDEYPSLR